MVCNRNEIGRLIKRTAMNFYDPAFESLKMEERVSLENFSILSFYPGD